MLRDMKKTITGIVAVVILSGFVVGKAWNDNRGNGYYMGPGMMWGGDYDSDNNGWYCPGEMGCWGNDDWNNRTKSDLNLTTQQQSSWDNARSSGIANQQLINDSIAYYARQVSRLQRNKSSYVQSDMNYIKQILTPDQYTRFLEKLFALDSDR